MSIVEHIKTHLKFSLRKLGFELRRVSDNTAPAPLYDDPMAVIFKRNSHELASLNCSLNHCISFNGMSFSDHGWHPFAQAAKEYLQTESRYYAGSSLERYYRNWQPQNALDALIGAKPGPAVLGDKLPYIKHTPWSHRNIEERTLYMKRILEIENGVFSNEQSIKPSDGYGLHGPVTSDKGQLEYERIINVVESIKRYGFDRSKGDITVEVLKRGDQFRFVIVHGHHRAAAMAALGYRYIPVEPIMLVEYEYVDHWTGVYKGIWTRTEALTYFDHLCDFCSLNWAIDHEMIKPSSC